jgi:putative Holliday junction resolvase
MNLDAVQTDVAMNNAENDKRIAGPILALDLGHRLVGVAVCDALLISITKLAPLRRSSWKQLLRDVTDLTIRLDAKTLVIGFPLSLNGLRGTAAIEVQRTAHNFARSLDLPVYLQDERLTSTEAEEQLRAAGHHRTEIRELVDSQAAAIILKDFIGGGQHRILVSRL